MARQQAMQQLSRSLDALEANPLLDYGCCLVMLKEANALAEALCPHKVLCRGVIDGCGGHPQTLRACRADAITYLFESITPYLSQLLAERGEVPSPLPPPSKPSP